MFGGIGGLIYTIIGFFVANNNGYMVFTDLNTILSLILAVVLWPLVLLGVDLNIAIF